MIDHASRLHAQLIAAGIPVVSVSLGKAGDWSTFRIQYAPEATAEQRQHGEAIRLAYDPALTYAEAMAAVPLPPGTVQAMVILAAPKAKEADRAAARALLDYAHDEILSSYDKAKKKP